MTKFAQSVVDLVRRVPAGHIVSYGQIAAHLGSPRAARQVGWTLRQLEGVELPWWRVINSAGRISIKGNIFHNTNQQRQLLRQEGVKVSEDFRIEIENYRFMI